MKGLPLRVWPIAAMAFIALWQWATLTANFHGNPTALFCTGALIPQPPLVRAENVYLFPNSTGYDGQQYHLIAHDPFLRTDLRNFVDDPRLRYRRILLPVLVYTAALGNSALIDPLYYTLSLLALGLGVYWSCRIAQRAGLQPAWGLLFLALPAVPISIDRLVIDGALTALTAGFVYYLPHGSRKLFAVLACAALTRETGWVLIAAYVLHLALRRDLRRAALFSLSALPALSWYAYVHAHTTGQPYGASFLPFSAILHVIANPWPYPPDIPFHALVIAADYLALAGILSAFACAFYLLARNPIDPVAITAALFALMALILQRTDQWENVYSYGRVYSPLLLCLAAQRRPALLIPTALLLPRIAIQLAPQLIGLFL